MRKSVRKLKSGFESSCGKTQEFIGFCRTFKSEFTKELLSINATNIEFSYGHFYISGFFTIGTQAWYFSLGDVRGMKYNLNRDCMGKLLYRTAQHYKDYSGGQNRYAKIEPGMGKEMCWSFQLV